VTAIRNDEARAGVLEAVPTFEPRLEFRVVHGYRRAFRVAGAGPALVLLHGIGDSSATWEDVIPALARNHLVIAPDLLGHGLSDRPRADYSVAGYANGLRDLLGVLGISRATVVGHSLGGAVAMQFAYQFPERTERLVLVCPSAGGPEVTAVLRLLSLPGAQALLHLLWLPTARWQVGLLVSVLRRMNTAIGQDAPDLLRMADEIPDATGRAAFARTLHSVVDWRGQVINLLDRCYLTRGMPTLLVWGSRDAVLPVTQAHRAHAAMPGSALEIFPGAGHYPFHTDPVRFVAAVEGFLAGTRPATWSLEQWRQLLRTGPVEPDVPVELGPAAERNAT
jgi:pimeloyl-ACP methyl ester carboxylesterase